MSKSLTVRESRKALEGVPDELEVKINSDTLSPRIVIELARHVQFDDVNYFEIYANSNDICVCD